MSVKIALVGEAWGEHEERARSPFVGPSGQELTRMLSDAGIRRADCYLTNVFNLRPPGNDIEKLCTTATGDHCGLPALRAGKYIRREFLPEIKRLYTELESVSPNLVIALGGTASWALLHNSAISKIRGTVAPSVVGPYKVLPAYHPAAVLRQWELRAVTVIDFIKANRESEFPEIRRPKRSVWIEPTLADIENFYYTHVVNAEWLAPDIETAGDQITCIGFAPNPQIAIVIPFTDWRKPNASYWLTADDEAKAWGWVRRYLSSKPKKIFQNGMYDMAFLWRAVGMTVANVEEDTMLMHHSLYPESPKGLDYLASIYSDEFAWKQMRKRGKTTIKREE